MVAPPAPDSRYAILEALAGNTPQWYDPFAREFTSTTLNPYAGMVQPGTFVGDRRADRTARDHARRAGTGSMGIIQWAESQLGVPYVWAAAEPGEAFDCSGFTMWVLKKAGISVPHLASAQQDQLPKVDRGDLQPGDLVFFNYGRKAAGVADHVGLYIGNGKMIDASSSQGEIVKREVDWDHFIGGGATGLAGETKYEVKHVDRPEFTQPAIDQTIAIPNWIGSRQGDSSFMGLVMATMLQPEDYTQEAPSYRGPKGSVKQQLWQGFMDAGRPDLAKMVNTRAFQIWINAESSWDVHKVSQSYNVAGTTGVNGGLFQIRYPAHPWAQGYFSQGNTPGDSGNSFTPSAYDQARMIAKHFHLTPAEIKTYAQQIQNGTYHGWG